MKAVTILAAACATAVFAESEQIEHRALFTIEVAPGETRQITEEERWELSAVRFYNHYKPVYAYLQ